MEIEPVNNDKKVGWFCTYTPEEVIYAAGFTPYRLLPHRNSGAGSIEDALPANLCPYPRRILSNLREGAYSELSGIVIANSCNAMTHLYNVMKDDSELFVYLLDIPRKQDEKAVKYFARELELLSEFLGEKGNPLTEKTLGQVTEIYRQRGDNIQKIIAQKDGLNSGRHFPAGLYGLSMEASFSSPVAFNQQLEELLSERRCHEELNKPEGTKAKDLNLMLAGGIPPEGLVEMLCEQPEINLYPENCTGLRYLQKPVPELRSGEESSVNAMLEIIAGNYLNKPPCPRIFDQQARENYYRLLLDDLEIQAVIYHDLMFCDMCHYDYLMLQDLLTEKDIPHLKVKSELGNEDLGQLKTRVEAFLEIVG